MQPPGSPEPFGSPLAGPRSVGFGPLRMCFDQTCEIFKSLAVVIAVPQNVADSIEGNGRLRPVRKITGDFLKKRHRLVSLSNREIKIRELGQILQP